MTLCLRKEFRLFICLSNSRSERKYFNSLTSTPAVIDILEDKYEICYNSHGIGKRYNTENVHNETCIRWVTPGRYTQTWHAMTIVAKAVIELGMCKMTLIGTDIGGETTS